MAVNPGFSGMIQGLIDKVMGPAATHKIQTYRKATGHPGTVTREKPAVLHYGYQYALTIHGIVCDGLMGQAVSLLQQFDVIVHAVEWKGSAAEMRVALPTPIKVEHRRCIVNSLYLHFPAEQLEIRRLDPEPGAERFFLGGPSPQDWVISDGSAQHRAKALFVHVDSYELLNTLVRSINQMGARVSESRLVDLGAESVGKILIDLPKQYDLRWRFLADFRRTFTSEQVQLWSRMVERK